MEQSRQCMVSILLAVDNVHVNIGSVAISNLAACVNSHCAVSNNTATLFLAYYCLIIIIVIFMQSESVI